MANRTKFITSHSERVKRANIYRRESPKKISIIDREAIVEFYLLEDVVRLFENNLKQSLEGYESAQQEYGKRAMLSNVTKFGAMLDVFKAATEVAWAQIIGENYKAVWKSIPEHALMVAAGNKKHLSKLKEIAKEMLGNLMEEALFAEGEKMSMDEYLAKAEAHDENVRAIRGLPSPADLKKLVEALEVVPDADYNRKSKLNPNII